MIANDTDVRLGATLEVQDPVTVLSILVVGEYPLKITALNTYSSYNQLNAQVAYQKQWQGNVCIMHHGEMSPSTCQPRILHVPGNSFSLWLLMIAAILNRGKWEV